MVVRRQTSFSAACRVPSAKRENVGVWGRSPQEEAPRAHERSVVVAAFRRSRRYERRIARCGVRSFPVADEIDERGPSGRRAPQYGPARGLLIPNSHKHAQHHTHFSDLYTIAATPNLTIPGTSATLIRRRSETFDGFPDAARHENMRFYSANCFRTHPGSPVGTQSPDFSDFFLFLLSHYLLGGRLIVTAYEL